MAILNTRIILRNDSTVNWNANLDQILLKGELGIEFLDSGKAKVKIGDGVKNWQELEYFGGEELLGDGKSVKVANGEICLVGFDAAEIGAQPRKNADGLIEWIVPSTETVDGLKSAVAGLQKDVAELQTDVASLQEIITPSGEGELPLLDRLETLENQMNGDGENSVVAIVNQEINKFANEISDDGTINTFKELVDYVAGHGAEFSAVVNDVTTLQELVGNKSVSDQIVEAITNSGHILENKALAIFKKIKYEISHKPTGTLVDYRDKEIRVMIPAGTQFELQNSGEGADPNAYYIGFKAYAPESAVSFKEDLAQTISDEEMYYFEGNDFAGIDANGRKYSIVWLPVAKYDGSTWNYYGKGSSANKFVGWYYTVEWYDANGIVIGTDTIRINLTNESCHNAIKPFYVPNIVSSDAENKISIAADGTMEVNSLNVNKLVQIDGEWLVMNGGNSTLN